ncbi:CLUMA_CG011930, isoform A [Clunio marinus]|uniref:CLUMA_CG011930, isoform A n=1 Tax=Clunio marinus TaxID=568069 RepID=A0A1J1IKB8_9DIPT|nr:CLUMA_CG011930, isoform A [Clunio marinus]
MKTFLNIILITAFIAICSAYHNEKCVTIPPADESPETPDSSSGPPICSDQCPIRDQRISVLTQELSVEREKMISSLEELLKPDERESFQNWLTNPNEVGEYLLPIGVGERRMDEGLAPLAMPVWPAIIIAGVSIVVAKIVDVVVDDWEDSGCNRCPPVPPEPYETIETFDENGVLRRKVTRQSTPSK